MHYHVSIIVFRFNHQWRWSLSSIKCQIGLLIDNQSNNVGLHAVIEHPSVGKTVYKRLGESMVLHTTVEVANICFDQIIFISSLVSWHIVLKVVIRFRKDFSENMQESTFVFRSENGLDNNLTDSAVYGHSGKGLGSIKQDLSNNRHELHMNKSNGIAQNGIVEGDKKSVRFEQQLNPDVQEVRNKSNGIAQNGIVQGDKKSVRFQQQPVVMDLSQDIQDERNFLQANDTSDLRITVEGKSLYVSRIMLSIISPVLKNMLATRSRDHTILEIPLLDKKYDDVLEFLKCVYPDILKPVSSKSISICLKQRFCFQLDAMFIS